jgi:hypothetical protein
MKRMEVRRPPGNLGLESLVLNGPAIIPLVDALAIDVPEVTTTDIRSSSPTSLRFATSQCLKVRENVVPSHPCQSLVMHSGKRHHSLKHPTGPFFVTLILRQRRLRPAQPLLNQLRHFGALKTSFHGLPSRRDEPC